MLAAGEGNTALCDYLIRNGADVASVDLNGSFSLLYYGVVRFAFLRFHVTQVRFIS